MKQEEFKANQEYLEENDIYPSNDAVWDMYPDSRELFKRTDGGGDFSLCVESLNRECVLTALENFWKEDFIQIANGMPY